MSDYEPFLIPVEVIGGKDAEKTLTNIDSKLKEISEDLMNVGYGADAMKTLTADMRALSSTSKTVASGISALNKANAQAAKDAEGVALAHQKVATEAGKTARELEKARTQTANTAVANQRLKTEMEKAIAAHTRAEMAALRLAQAHEKEAQKALQAASPYNQLNRALKEQADKLRNALAAGNMNQVTVQRMADKYNRLKGELDTTNAKFNALTGSIKTTHSIGMAFASFLGNLAANVFQQVISSLGRMVQELSKAGVALDGIKNTFAAGARGWKQGGEEMLWVAETAEKLGLNLQSTYEPYAKFMTSFTRSGGTLQESRQIFEDLSTAMVSLHLSSDQMNNVFVALEQMANKGTVQAEELKRQLGNALPGAFELAAQSMNLTTAELMDMMKKGEVVSRDFLPRFAALVKDSLGTQIGIAVNQYNAHLNRLKSQTFLLQASLGQILNEALTPLVQGLTSVVRGANLLIKAFGDSTTAATALQSIFLALGVSLGIYIAKTTAATIATLNLALAEGTKLASSLTLAQKALLSLNTLLTTNVTMAGLATAATNTLKAAWTAIAAHPIGAILIAVGTAALYCANSINKANKDIAEQYVQIQDYSNNLTGLISEYSQLSAVQNKTTAQQEAYNRALNDLSEKYPTVLKYIQDNKVNLNNLTKEQADNIASLAAMQMTQDAELVKLQELSNGWIIFGTRCKQVGKAVLLVVQAIEAAVAHLVIAAGQAFTRWFALVMKGYGELTEKSAWVMSHIGQKELAVSLDNVTKKLKGWANNAWDIGKEAHSNLNGAIGMLAQDIANVEVERIQKAEKNFKDSLAKIGQDQAKLAQQLMYSSNNLTGVATGEQGKKKGKSAKEKKKEVEDEWQALNKKKEAVLEQIRVGKLLGKDTSDLEKTYKGYQTQIDSVTEAIKKLNAEEKALNMTAAEKAIKDWEDKKKALQNAEKQYKGMLLAGNAYTKAQREQQRETMKVLKAEVAYNEQLENQEDLMKITSRTAQQFTNSVFDSLFEPLREGESLWTRFKDAGVNALKSIAQTWTKQFLQNIVTGFGAGFTTNRANGANFMQSLAGGFTGSITQLAKAPLQTNIFGTQPQQGGGSSGGVLSNIMNSVKGLFGGGTSTSGIGSSITGGSNAIGVMTNVGAIGQSILGNLNTGASVLSQTLQTATTPAVSSVLGGITNLGGTATGAGTSLLNMGTSALGAGSSILGMANPAVLAAQSIIGMATAAPIAAIGMGALGATMMTASSGFLMAAPALTMVSAAMQGIAASATTAASAMAAYAVAAAAASVAWIPIAGMVLAPLAAMLTGAAIAAGTAMVGAAIGASSAIAGIGGGIGSAAQGLGNKVAGIGTSGLGSGASSAGASVVPHAKGGIVSSPTMFPMQGGNIGLAGEAGTEVIAPARRMSNGDVGIGAVQPQVTVNNYTNAAVEVIKRPNNEMEIKISELNSMLSSSKTNQGWANAQTRMSRQGRQIG